MSGLTGGYSRVCSSCRRAYDPTTHFDSCPHARIEGKSDEEAPSAAAFLEAPAAVRGPDERDVRTWVKANIERKMKQFGLSHWRIEIDYAPLETARMNCTMFQGYERAAITVDPSSYREYTIETVESDLEHELLHVVHAPFEMMRDIAFQHLSEGEFRTYDAIHKHACEMTVRNMERLVFSLRADDERQAKLP